MYTNVYYIYYYISVCKGCIIYINYIRRVCKNITYIIAARSQLPVMFWIM